MPVKAKFGSKTNMKSDNFIKYILMGALVILIGFTIVYVLNISKSMRNEQFTDEESSITIIYMYSDSCPYCQQFNPIFNQFSTHMNTNSPSIVIKKVEKNDATAAKYMKHISGYPTVLVEKNGEIIGSQVGKTSLVELKSFVEKHV